MASEGGLPKATFLAAIATIGLVGTMAFFIITWNQRRAAAATLRQEIADLDVTIAEREAELAPETRRLTALRGQTDLFSRGRMCVLNPSSDQRVTVSKLAIVYLDEAGGFQTFNSELVGSVRWTVEPGHQRFLDHLGSGWDGAVTYFALWYEVGGQEYPLAQPWPLDPEHCVRLVVP